MKSRKTLETVIEEILWGFLDKRVKDEESA